MLISVYDTDPNNRTKIKEMLVAYSIQYDREFDLLWITEPEAIEKSKEYLLSCCASFISLDSKEASKFASFAYSQNPDMRICFYKKEEYDVVPLLSTRPMGFFLLNENRKEFFEKANVLFYDIAHSSHYFYYSTRNSVLCYPMRAITYLSSELKYVFVHKQNGESDKIYAKLADVEKDLNREFIRIHKSYLVNPKHLCYIDKRSHEVILDTGEVLPISDPYYREVVDFLQKMSKNAAL